MQYNQYVTKKRTRLKGICGEVNLPYGTVLTAAGGFILLDGKCLCAVASQNGKDYFWGYDPKNPKTEIKRQKTVAKLMALAPPGAGDTLAREDNPWREYGRMVQTPGAWRWEWNPVVQDYPQFLLEDLLHRIALGGTPPKE